jgi:predicted O-methyltransferase YrrM
MTTPPIDPTRIFQLGEGFMASKTLLSAIEIDLFTVLGNDRMTGPQIGEKLGLHPRAIPDFPDTLVALGMLDRDDESEPRYRNTTETAAYLDRSSPTYLGGVLEMCNSRLYGFWGDLTQALQTGAPQNEIKHTGQPMFAELYSDPKRLQQFMNAMTGASMTGFHALAETFDFTSYHTVCDLGGATGQLSVILAARHPHLRCTTFDLPAVEPLAQQTINTARLGDRVRTASGDFFVDPIPEADVITMGMILHDHNLDRKKELIQAAYDALTPGGALISIEAFIDDARRTDTFALLMSLNMLIEFGDGFGFTGKDFTEWCTDAGFSETTITPLAGWASAGIARK